MRSLLLWFCLLGADSLETYNLPEGAYLTNGPFAVAPDYTTNNPLWVVEYLTKDDLSGPGDRAKSKWKPDRHLPLRFRIGDDDYLHSGFDKGHLPSAANHHRNQIDMDWTHTYSDVCPQYHTFNAGIWLTKEDVVRATVLDPKTSGVWICNLPLYESDFGMCGRSKVPSHFGAAILIRYVGGGLNMRAWIIPHLKTGLKDLDSYQIPTKEFQDRSGLDLWSGLEDSIEKNLESRK